MADRRKPRRRKLGRPRNRDRRPGDPSSRERIVEAASRLFAQRGTRATTMQQVAARAGFTVGALYRHFHGKPALLLAVVAAALEKIPLLQAGSAGPRGKVSEIVGAYVTPEADVSRKLAREVHTAARRDPRVRRLLDRFNRGVRGALTARVAELDGAPVAAADVTADLLLVIVLGLAHLDTLAPDRCDRPEFRAAVEQAVERILGQR